MPGSVQCLCWRRLYRRHAGHLASCPLCEAFGELRAVVGQQFDYPDRRGQLEPAQRSTLPLSVSSARDEVIGRGTDGSCPISSLDQATTRSHTKSLAGHPGLNPIIGSSSFKNHGSGESKLLVAIQWHRPLPPRSRHRSDAFDICHRSRLSVVINNAVCVEHSSS